MIFSIQRYLEDYFEQRGLSNTDQYAIQIASLYDQLHVNSSEEDVLKAMHSVHTIFFRNNASLNRVQFERDLLSRLNIQFKKKDNPAECQSELAREDTPLNNQHKGNRLSSVPLNVQEIVSLDNNLLEQIAQQQHLLSTFRRTLSHYLTQLAIQSSAFVQPAVLHGIEEARDNINRIKKTLRGWGVKVDDSPNDDYP